MLPTRVPAGGFLVGQHRVGALVVSPDSSMEDAQVGSSSPSEEERFHLADVAQLYYVDDLTQEQIARRIGVSRSNVSRMLKEALDRGLVEIRIHHPLQTVPTLHHALCERFGLRDSLVLAALPPNIGSDATP